MTYIQIGSGEVITMRHLRSMYPNISFPPTLTKVLMEEYGLKPLVETSQPKFDSLTQSLRSEIVYLGDTCERRWYVTDLPLPKAEANIRAKRQELLAATDWTQLADAPEVPKPLWAKYRAALRGITEQQGFPFAVVWPDPPYHDYLPMPKE